MISFVDFEYAGDNLSNEKQFEIVSFVRSFTLFFFFFFGLYFFDLTSLVVEDPGK